MRTYLTKLENEYYQAMKHAVQDGWKINWQAMIK